MCELGCCVQGTAGGAAAALSAKMHKMQKKKQQKFKSHCLLAVAISVARTHKHFNALLNAHTHTHAGKRCNLRVARAQTAETTAEVTQVSGRGTGRGRDNIGKEAEEVILGEERSKVPTTFYRMHLALKPRS